MLSLGGVVFHGFEIPDKIPFDGSQTHVKHELIGGSRIVDAMGPSDHDITWSGRFQGANAWNRARQLDTMRIAGIPVALVVDTEFRLVLIAKLTLGYERPYQVPYAISLVVIDQDGATQPNSDSLDTVTSQDLGNVQTTTAAVATTAAQPQGSNQTFDDVSARFTGGF